MNETQNSNKNFRLVGSICSVLALVLGIICLLFSFIPLFGALAFYPSLFAFVCAVVGLVFAVKANSSTGASITALVISLLALVFSYMSYVAIRGVVGDTSRYEKAEKTETQTVAMQTEKQETTEEETKKQGETEEETQETKKNIEESTHKDIEDLGDGWNRFHHKQYDFSLELPDIFGVGYNSLESSYYLKEWKVTSAGTQYYDIKNKKNSRDIVINVTDVTSNRNKKYLQDRYQNYLKDKKVAYKVLYDNWYVVSHKYNNEISYEKAFFKNNHIYFLQIRYKNHEKNYIEPLLDRIQKSFM